MSEEILTPSPSYFWPVLFVSLAFNLIVGFQLYSVATETMKLRTQEIDTAKQIKDYRRTVVPARNVQALLQALANDMLEMSNNDPDIRKLVEKYQIRRAGNPPQSPAQ